MPPLTRYFLRTALGYLVVALLVGLVLALRPVISLSPVTGALGPAYFHLLMVGWVTQLIFGIAFWMFPRHSKEQPHRSERLGWATYILLNLGLVLRVLAEPALAVASLPSAGPILDWVLVFSALSQWLAVMAFVVNTWSRVK